MVAALQKISERAGHKTAAVEDIWAVAQALAGDVGTVLTIGAIDDSVGMTMIDAGSDCAQTIAPDLGILCEAPGKPVAQGLAAGGIPGFGEAQPWMNFQVGRDRDHDLALVGLAAVGLATRTLTSPPSTAITLHSHSFPSIC